RRQGAVVNADFVQQPIKERTPGRQVTKLNVGVIVKYRGRGSRIGLLLSINKKAIHAGHVGKRDIVPSVGIPSRICAEESRCRTAHFQAATPILSANGVVGAFAEKDVARRVTISDGGARAEPEVDGEWPAGPKGRAVGN